MTWPLLSNGHFEACTIAVSQQQSRETGECVENRPCLVRTERLVYR